MAFLQDHFSNFGKFLGYHARTLGRRHHRRALLGVCSGEGRATAVLIQGGRIVGLLDDFTALLDPPVRGDTIKGEWASRINAVDADDRPRRVDSFRRKFLDAAGSRGRVRAALVLDRPKGTMVSDTWAGRRGDTETNMGASSMLDNIRRNPKEKIESWTGDDKLPWNWYLLLPTMEAPKSDQSYTQFLAFGSLAPDSEELEAWAERTGRVEWDLCMTGHYATLRFLAQGFFAAHEPCMVARVYQNGEKDYRAFLCGWNGERVNHITSNIEVTSGMTLASRAGRLANAIQKESDERRVANKESALDKPTQIPLYVLAAPTAPLPIAAPNDLFTVVPLRKNVLCDPAGVFRSRCPDVAKHLDGDLPGTPEVALAIWAALRIPEFSDAWADENPTDQFLTPSYQEIQVARTAPLMRRSAALTLVLFAATFFALLLAGILYWDGGNAQDEQAASIAKAKTRESELSKYGDTALRLEDLSRWRLQAERVPASALLVRLSNSLPDTLALREIRVRSLLNSLGDPTGYELVLSGFARAGSPEPVKLLGDVFPGANVREIPPTNLVPGATTSDGTIIAADDSNLQAWRVGVNLAFSDLDPATYKLKAVDPAADAAPARP